LGKFSNLNHGHAKRLNFLRVEETDDVRCLLFTQQKHKDRRTLGAGYILELSLKRLIVAA
jgi:hypothetical protein